MSDREEEERFYVLEARLARQGCGAKSVDWYCSEFERWMSE